MRILGFQIGPKPKVSQPTLSRADFDAFENKQSSSYGQGRWYGAARMDFFDGEKTPGELGFLKDSRPNHKALRYRAFEAQLKSDVVKIITGKFFKWVVGSGLKLQAEPDVEVLKSEGIVLPKVAEFSNLVEARFNVYSNSIYSDYKRMDNLHQKAGECFETAFLGGDALCILRLDDGGNVNVQILDGEHIQTPVMDHIMMNSIKKRKATVRHGIETDARGRHVAYYVRTLDSTNPLGKYERISAVGQKSQKVMAWMIYGSKHRIDHLRGIPVISQILEKIDKLDRYTEATVGTAEERAKIVLAIEHSRDSDGENPFLNKAKAAVGKGFNAAPETVGYEAGEKTATLIAATTSKQTFNLPIGSKLTSPLDSSQTMEYGPFSKAVFSFLCASVDIPPEVAMQLYEQNYSSSRAAINGWEYVVKIYRKRFSDKFYSNFYKLWLEMEILSGKIQAPGYLKASLDANFMALEAYSTARFTGANMPHIDPLKEVKAVREMLGKNNTDPLASREQVSELLGLGNWEKNNSKYNEETDKVIKDEPTDINNGQPGGNLDDK